MSDPEARARKAFNDTDVDGSGKVSASELQKVFEKMGKDPEKAAEHAKTYIAQRDSDNDGEITFEEFITRVKTYF